MQKTRTFTISENLIFDHTSKLLKKPKVVLSASWLADQGFIADHKVHITLTQRTFDKTKLL